MLGGIVGEPIAERTSDRTTTIRTNDVVITAMNGTIESNVSPASASSGSDARECANSAKRSSTALMVDAANFA